MSLMPCFNPNQAGAEGIVIGRLLAGYGEIEMEMCGCLIAVRYQFDSSVRDIFEKPGAESRIRRAKKFLRHDFAAAGLQAELAETLADMDWCRRIRNQYAHCQWYWTPHEGLCFVNLEDLAGQPGPITQLTASRFSIDVALLEDQEEFFFNVKARLKNLADRYKEWDQHRLGAVPSTHIYPKPSKATRPNLHN